MQELAQSFVEDVRAISTLFCLRVTVVAGLSGVSVVVVDVVVVVVLEFTVSLASDVGDI